MASRLVRTEYGSGHTYALDGHRVPGVTTVIRNSCPPGGLLSWYAKQAASWAATHVTELGTLGEDAWVSLAAQAADRARDAAADRGRKVHAAADKLIDGEPVEIDEPDVLARAQLVVDFLEAWDAHVLAREAVVFNERYGYAGTFDLIADLSDGKRWLLDYKTGSGVYRDVALQLAAYRHATHLVWQGRDVSMPTVDACGVVWVRESSWELVPTVADNNVFSTFLSSLPVYRFHGTKLGKDAVGGPLPKPDEREAATNE